MGRNYDSNYDADHFTLHIFTLFDIVCTLHESCLDMFGTHGGNQSLRSTLVPPCIQRAPFVAAPIGLARALRAGCLDDCWICMELC